jgi:hypothetical protein
MTNKERFSMSRIAKHKLNSKKLYEFAKGKRELTENSSKKTSPKISKEFVEKNIEFFLKKDCGTLKRLSLSLINNNEDPRLPEVLHNKMIAYNLVSVESGKSKTKIRKQKRDTKNAKEYFEVLSIYEETKSFPKVKNRWKSEREGKDVFIKKYRAGSSRELIINELSEEELKFMAFDNPYYLYKYAVTTKKRLTPNIENIFLNEPVEEYVLWFSRYRGVYKLPTIQIILNYCDKFNISLPASMHNKILFLSASDETYTDYRVRNEGEKYKGLSPREIPESRYCLYRRYLSRYQKFVEGLNNFIIKKRLNYDNKISDLLKKRMSKKDRRYLETYIEVQMLDKNESLKLFSKKEAA